MRFMAKSEVTAMMSPTEASSAVSSRFICARMGGCACVCVGGGG